MQRPEIHQILNNFLKTTSVPYNDQADCVIETDPILSAAATMQISPGEQAQDLHRDDFIWQRTHTKSGGSYEPGSDTSMGLIVAGSETTTANGATVVRFTSSRKRQKIDRASCSSYPNRIYGTIPDVRKPMKHDTQKWMWVKHSFSLVPRCTGVVQMSRLRAVLFMASSSAVHGCDQR